MLTQYIVYKKETGFRVAAAVDCFVFYTTEIDRCVAR